MDKCGGEYDAPSFPVHIVVGGGRTGKARGQIGSSSYREGL